MNRDQKAAFIDDVAQRVGDSDAIFAIDYRGISVSQVAELRAKLREADASFQIVKNTLTRIALDNAKQTDLKEFLEGPTAFTYVRGDVALAAKAIANFTKEYELLEFKGGRMEGQVISVDQFKELSKLPGREVLVGRLVGMIASPLTNLVGGMNGLIGGLASQLGQIQSQGLIGADASSSEVVADSAGADVASDSQEGESTGDIDTDGAEQASAEAPADEPAAEEAPVEEAPAEDAPPEEKSSDAEADGGDESGPPEDESSDAEAGGEDAPADEPGEDASDDVGSTEDAE